MWTVLHSFRLRDAVDILVVAVVLYRVFVMFKETRAVQMLLGLGGLMVASFVARRFELYSTSWLLENFWSFWVLALIVLFQPELRRALAQLGQSRFFQGMALVAREQQSHLFDDVVKAADALAAKRIGALVVLERSTGLRNYAELGVPLDALVSADLLVSLFLPYSPLHDGAVFIRGNRVAAAGCFLPLSRNTQLARAMGTRHRAALGLAEETDAVVLVVSEETGRISLAVGGNMESPLDRDVLRRRLVELVSLGAESTAASPPGSAWCARRCGRRAPRPLPRSRAREPALRHRRHSRRGQRGAADDGAGAETRASARGHAARASRRLQGAAGRGAGHAALGAAARGGPRLGSALGRRGCLCGGRGADAGHRPSDAPAGGPRRRGALGVPQPLRGQRHQDLLRRGRQAARRLGGRNRAAAGGTGWRPQTNRRADR